jgi:hypothetical protein
LIQGSSANLNGVVNVADEDVQANIVGQDMEEDTSALEHPAACEEVIDDHENQEGKNVLLYLPTE